MKNKINLLCVLFFLFFVSSNAQVPYFYYYKGKKINLTVDRNYVHIIADDEFMKSSSSSQLFKKFNIELNNSKRVQDMVKLKFKSIPDMQEYSKFIESLKENGQVKHVLPFFERGVAPPIGTSDIFYLKLKDEKDTVLLQKIVEQQNVQIIKQVPYMPQWYILSIRNSIFCNSIDATNYFYEIGYFEDIEPAFMFNFKVNCTNDGEFILQWGLNNIGQLGVGTIPGIDIKACDAWTITRGAGVNVAVVDRGIDFDHDDLADNKHPLSFDAQSGTSPSIFTCLDPPFCYHGTHVAGIVAAVNNGLQVVGVAPESKIMGVSHDLEIDLFDTNPTISAELASGINWAWNEAGADIINCSWGDQGGFHFYEYYSPILEEAIINAIVQGRDGKGSVVVFAAGNYGANGPVMDYPGNFYPEILTVGSIDRYAQRSVFPSLIPQASGYGSELDVAAPGSFINSTIPDNMTDFMSGTSMAAPHVAGIAALVLSVSPNLSGQQVRDIIESTCQKINKKEPLSNPSGYVYSTTSGRPNGTWNDEMGYGLVDAYAAVQKAQCIVNFTGTSTSPIIVTTNTTITSCGDIYLENVNVTQGAKLTIKAAGDVIFGGGFGCTDGATYEIKEAK